MVARVAIGEIEDAKSLDGKEYARKGGLKGGAAREKSLTEKEHKEIAKMASQSRWKNH